MKKLFQDKALIYGAFVATLFVVGCLTINVYFPAAAVQEAANAFVEDVQEGGENADPAAQDPSDAKTSPKEGFLRINWIGRAYAQGEDAININTPEASRLKGSMKKRNSNMVMFCICRNRWN